MLELILAGRYDAMNMIGFVQQLEFIVFNHFNLITMLLLEGSVAKILIRIFPRRLVSIKGRSFIKGPGGKHEARVVYDFLVRLAMKQQYTSCCWWRLNQAVKNTWLSMHAWEKWVNLGTNFHSRYHAACFLWDRLELNLRHLFFCGKGVLWFVINCFHFFFWSNYIGTGFDQPYLH